LMRAANFDFSHGRIQHGLQLGRRILSQTGEFDEMVFSYYLHSGVATAELLNTAVPAEERPARAWLAWTGKNGPVKDLPAVWAWMIRNDLLDSETTVDVAQTLWRQSAFQPAQQLWIDWLGKNRGNYPDRQQLWNPRFQGEPSGSPFDWTVSAPAGNVSAAEGLEILFSADASGDVDVHQFTMANLGRYRFSAEIAAEGLSAGECTSFHIFDSSHQLNVRTQPIKGTMERSWVNLDFDVPSKARALEIQLACHAPTRFGDRIRGSLHIYQVSLTRAPAPVEQ